MKLRGIVAGLGVLVLAGCGGQAAAPATVTVTAAAPPARTVLAPTTVPGPTTTVTATSTLAVTATATAAAAPAGGGGSGPFSDGTYLVGAEVAVGNYKCNAADSSTRWIIEDSAGETVDIDFSSVARVPSDGYTVQFKACSGQWEKVG